MRYTLWVYYTPDEEDDGKVFREVTDVVGRVSPKTIYGPEENAMVWSYSGEPSFSRIILNLLALPYVTRVSITR
jgi:hypothetical protein